MTARAEHSPGAGEPLALLGLVLGALVWSGVAPRDRLTWWLEVAPVLLAAPVLVLTWPRFPLTRIAYRLVALHALVLVLGGHYTYAHVPLGFWLQDALDLARNPYDRVAHFVQGLVPAILAREVLLRRSPLVPGKWLFFLVSCVGLAISASYELLEWWAALLGGDGTVAFLGTQGDPWDTQWDMLLALLGTVSAQLALSGAHDRALEELARTLAR